MNENTHSRRRKSVFARIFLEVTLSMIFVFIMTYSPGKSSGRNDPLKISSQKNATGQGVDLEHATILVTPEGFILEGQPIGRDELAIYLGNEGMKLRLLRIEPAKTIDENLRWLLDAAGKTHDIELAL